MGRPSPSKSNSSSGGTFLPCWCLRPDLAHELGIRGHAPALGTVGWRHLDHRLRGGGTLSALVSLPALSRATFRLAILLQFKRMCPLRAARRNSYDEVARWLHPLSEDELGQTLSCLSLARLSSCGQVGRCLLPFSLSLVSIFGDGISILIAVMRAATSSRPLRSLPCSQRHKREH